VLDFPKLNFDNEQIKRDTEYKSIKGKTDKRVKSYFILINKEIAKKKKFTKLHKTSKSCSCYVMMAYKNC
jgi:hypothetical protein